MYLADFSKHANSSAALRRRMQQRGVTFKGYPIWTPREDDICRKHYPDYKALQKALPGQTSKAIESRCYHLNLTRRIKKWTAPEDKKFRVIYRTGSVSELRAAFPLVTLKSLHDHARIIGIRRPPRPLTSTGSDALDELRAECRRLNMTARDLDAYSKSRYFTCKGWTSKKRRIDYRAIGRVVDALGGKLKIEWAR